jgi:hypothetical protein
MEFQQFIKQTKPTVTHTNSQKIYFILYLENGSFLSMRHTINAILSKTKKY